MSPKKAKNRTSILKKRRSSFESPEATSTNTEKPRKGILFSDKNTVKEFMQCDEKTTIWGNSYELSLAKSDGSSDNSSSKKLSFDFTCNSLQATSVSVTSMVLEADKENLITPEQEIVPHSSKESLEIASRSNSLNNSSGLTNLTVEIHAEEKARVRKYGTENLNITNNINLDMSMKSKVKINEESMVLSPRKTIYFNDNANISVCIQDKVLVKEEASKNTSDSFTFLLEEDEKANLQSCRKTILNHDDMDLTLDVSKVNKSAFIKPQVATKIFRQPETPKPFRMAPRFLDGQSMNLSSPPIKQPSAEPQKPYVEEMMEYLINETPTKNLCRQMCQAKKHSITPMQNLPPSKLAATSSIDKPRIRTLQNISFDLRSPQSQQTDKNESVMDLEEEEKFKKRPELLRNRKTVFDASISVEPTACRTTSSVLEARKTLFEDDMNETFVAKPFQQTFFDLDIGETVAGTKSITWVRLKDLPEPAEQKTLYENDVSFTCNFADFKPCSTMINCTNIDETGVSESTNELAQKAERLLKNPMATTASNSNLFSKNDEFEMEETEITLNSHRKSLPVRFSSRKTVFDENISLNENFSHEIVESQFKFVSKSDIDISGIEPTDEIPRNIVKKARDTIYSDKSIEEETEVKESEKSLKKSMEPIDEIPGNIVKKARDTIYSDKSIEEETEVKESEKSLKKSIEKSRLSIYDSQAIQEDVEVTKSGESSKNLFKKPRATIYSNQSIQEESEIKASTEIFNKEIKKPCSTINANQSIQEDTGMKVTKESLKNLTEKHRETIYADQSIQEDTKTKQSVETSKKMVQKSRGTIYANQSILDETNFEKIHENSHKKTMLDENLTTETSIFCQTSKRKTIHENTAINETIVGCELNFKDELQPEIEGTNNKKISIYKDSPIKEESKIEDDIDFDVPMERHATFSLSVQHFETSHRNNSSRISALSFNVKDSLHRPEIEEQNSFNLTPSFVPPPPEFNSPMFEVPPPENFEMEEDTVTRSSVIVAPKKNLSGLRVNHLRKTVYDAVNMEVDEGKSPEDRTFILKNRDDSRKLMNITDADIISLIDDESNPCINESTQSSGQHRISFSGNNSTCYQNALQDFINITIMNSPLNATSCEPTPAPVGRTKNRVIHEPVDFCLKLDDLMQTLEKKDEPAPRLDIDDFLEKLNIQPVIIPHYPQLEPDYLETEIEKIKEKIVKEAAERKARLAEIEMMHQPVIPPSWFLFKNKRENLDEEIRQLRVFEPTSLITPVFPELRDFDFLLQNKFDTDEHLSKFWKLDLLWSHMSQYKVFHKLLPCFKINLSVKKSQGNINEATIPIFFEKVLMYINPDFRGKKSLRTNLHMNELKRLIGTDNFISMCSSTGQLCSFLDFFHQNAMKTITIVDNFFSIISKNSAIVEKHEEINSLQIVKRHWNQDDIVDVKINLSHIDDTCINSITVKSHTRFAYELQPRQAIVELKGLMLIEVVLFNIQKFLHDNFKRIQIE